ncbi:putative fatty acyl-CoA reductase CG5065 [Helicoverpa zea]|uniref:putative fatty acyl-CoA reductase CG5065 n=1 Tax=Helicoverpa zea TaxID=7113 RepID=UPI001F5719F1|nr:putative fatty acyl-CoA reductase CG5065 [Helicoverpa zea]
MKCLNEEQDVRKDNETTTSITHSSVPEFYAGKSVFITGGTGFLGKVFLEKLLYSCKDIVTIYVLIRDKKGKSAQQRIEELVNKPLFTRLRSERPHDLKKLVPVVGDTSLPNLGISTEDEEILIQKVTAVFHVAANVKFHEELEIPVNTNIRGTSLVLDLCRRMENLEVFVHISTVFCHTSQKILEEKLYPPPAELSEVFKYLEQSNQDRRQLKTLLNGQPNTYTFTKALAETYVAENHGNIPTVIVRPAIVTGSLKEPLPGWVDHWLGATGLFAATAKGANRVLLGNPNYNLDLIPVDYVANLAIVAATRCRTDEVSIYNCCTSSCNPITEGKIYEYLQIVCKNNGFDIPRLIFTENKLILSIQTFLLQTTPAYFMDLVRRVRGKKPMYMKIQSQVVSVRNVLNYFTSRSWEMKADRTRELHASLSSEDRLQFPCDPCHIDWEDYTNVYLKGIEQFLMVRK